MTTIRASDFDIKGKFTPTHAVISSADGVPAYEDAPLGAPLGGLVIHTSPYVPKDRIYLFANKWVEEYDYGLTHSYVDRAGRVWWNEYQNWWLFGYLYGPTTRYRKPTFNETIRRNQGWATGQLGGAR